MSHDPRRVHLCADRTCLHLDGPTSETLAGPFAHPIGDELLTSAYQALYAVQVATGQTLYELLHDCEVFEADPEPLADLLERIERALPMEN